MSRWRDVVRRELYRYQQETGIDIVERQDLLEQSLPVLEQEFPDAKTPGQTLSRVLQELSRRDEIEFLDFDGTYRILNLDVDPSTVDSDVEEEAFTARTYNTTVEARSVPTAFRNAVLSWYDTRCPVSGVDHAGLLDVAHILPWSDYTDYRTDPGNVMVLDKTHHAAFDRGLFTLDDRYRIVIAPDFDSESQLLQRSLFEREGERVEIPEKRKPAPDYLREYNSGLDWW